MTNSLKLYSLAAVLALLGGCQSPVVDQPTIPATQPTSTARSPMSVAGITRTLVHVRTCLDGRMVTQFTDPATGKVLQYPPDQKLPADASILSATSYPAGVIYAGMLAAANATGDKSFSDFVGQRFQFFAENIPKFANASGKQAKNPFRNWLAPTSLDSCGAMGAAFIKARRAGVGGDLKPHIDRFAKFINHTQFRLQDGTLARNRPFANSIWADDMYMSVPLLAQLGAMSNQASYYDDAARQVTQISARLFVPASGLYTHGWNAQTGDNQPHYYWGRANGWCAMAMVELLDVLPQDHPKRNEILALLRAQAKGLASVQSGSGLWHQMLDRPDSYPETSASAMFTFAIARGVNRGWLDAGAYGPVAIAGWRGVATRIDSEGHVTGTCVGTSYADDYPYYYDRQMTDDQHGYGPVLLAGAEMIQLLKNPKFHIRDETGYPVMFP